MLDRHHKIITTLIDLFVVMYCRFKVEFEGFH